MADGSPESARKPASATSHPTPHTLRHTAASNAIALGADLVMVQKLLGHSSIQSTMNYLQAIEGLDNSPTYLLDKAYHPDDTEDQP